MGTRRFAAFMLTFLVAASLTALGVRLITSGLAAMGCRQYRGSDAFLAYCDTEHFAYYEHGAMFLGLEPEATAALRRADVIFFGTSRVQFAFSTDAVRRYFKDRSIPFYLLGFSYGESAMLPMSIAQREHLRPKVAVMTTDPFFTPGGSPAARALVDSESSWTVRAKVWAEYASKKAFAAAQRAICSAAPSACPQNIGSLYRRYSDGTWIWRETWWGPAPPHPMPDDQLTLEAWPPSNAATDREYALRFLATAGVKPECAVITAPPNDYRNFESYAKSLGSAIGANIIIPQLSGLTGIDTSHLDWESATRWSQAFLTELDPIIRRCVGQQHGPSVTSSLDPSP